MSVSRAALSVSWNRINIYKFKTAKIIQLIPEHFIRSRFVSFSIMCLWMQYFYFFGTMSIDRIAKRMEGDKTLITLATHTHRTNVSSDFQFRMLYFFLAACTMNGGSLFGPRKNTNFGRDWLVYRFYDFKILYQHWPNTFFAYRRQWSIVNVTRWRWATHFRCGDTQRHYFAAGYGFLRKSITVTDRRWSRHTSHAIWISFSLFVRFFIQSINWMETRKNGD